jgi:MinD superfamily P-loop ATPase
MVGYNNPPFSYYIGKQMNIAVLSGKGGTGKTFVSTNLANIIPSSTYLDCDVEEPNGRIFFNNQDGIVKEEVFRLLPSIDKDKCIGCRACVDFCKFSALAFFGDSPMLFPEICHSCGGCEKVCPTGAITEVKSSVGIVEVNKYKNTKVVSGLLNIGEASSIPVISRVLDEIEGTSVIDCPPGSACSTMESIKKADYCVLVTEPTVFGLHNLKMIVELVQLFKIPFGFVINKVEDPQNTLIEDYLRTLNKESLIKIPFSKEVANKVASGTLITDTDKDMRHLFETLLIDIAKECE